MVQVRAKSRLVLACAYRRLGRHVLEKAGEFVALDEVSFRYCYVSSWDRQDGVRCAKKE